MDSRPNRDRFENDAPHSTPWRGIQFSVRDLLVTMTIVSICLAVGVHFVGFMFVVIVMAGVQVSTLLAGDWLIRPQNRRVLAFVTAGSWTTLGSGLLVLAIRAMLNAIYERTNSPDKAEAATMLAILLVVGAVFCYLFAAFRWRQLTERS